MDFSWCNKNQPKYQYQNFYLAMATISLDFKNGNTIHCITSQHYNRVLKETQRNLLIACKRSAYHIHIVYFMRILLKRISNFHKLNNQFKNKVQVKVHKSRI